MAKFSELGQLPYFTQLPNDKKQQLRNWLENSDINIVGLGTSINGEQLSGAASIVFFSFPQVPPAAPTLVDDLLIKRLCAGFPALLQLIMGARHSFNIADIDGVDVPALFAHKVIADRINVDPPNTMASMLFSEYMPYNRNIVGQFLAELRKMFVVGGTYARQKGKEGLPVRGSQDAMVYINPDVVLIDKGVLPLINERLKPKIGANSLVHELKLCSYLQVIPQYDFDTSRYWALPREVWDSRVQRRKDSGVANLVLLKSVSA